MTEEQVNKIIALPESINSKLESAIDGDKNVKITVQNEPIEVCGDVTAHEPRD